MGPGFLRMIRKKPMTTLFKTLTTTARNWVRYQTTRAEIARLPLDIALDLGIFPGDADKIARKAVWG
jgi:uncharacterized protein YjiS (DUF1127 family)